ncbi:MAG: 5-formyltetrahydrofolate cyclo-ligase [Acaryochloris sp. RU_4_1]|nr:5-formyltetrahydrofolate cyclo-ligase [Acaryochloris sp. RU_4_1]NJR56293.1 5-formyltetrahydrofolate cyclo-ligase [Acaryochloris sp. CRU_2_0]
MQLTGADSALTKTQLRRQLLVQRQSMPAQQWCLLSQILCQQLQRSPVWQQAQTVLAYMTFRQEPDLRELLTQAEQSHQWGLPRCVGQDLVWHRWHPQQLEVLQPSQYGILEPPSNLPLLGATEVDLILVPAVACDRNGFRLGYGGGYYDRLLATPTWSTVPTIGIVFEQAYLDHLPTDPWDQPLDAICTEKGLFFN